MSELDRLVGELVGWLRIPSISIGGRDEVGLHAAAEWALRRVHDAGGSGELVPTSCGAPLVVGELRSARADAPTVLIYGHYDVQGPGDLAAWESPPFEPEIRDGHLYARGACDDKGNFLPLLHVACAMSAAGELPVHVRVLIEGSEEADADDVDQWVLADERGADCALVFDVHGFDRETPALTVAARGMVFATVEVRTGELPVHSGMFGGAALNAVHALHAALTGVMPGLDGRLPAPLRAGVAPLTVEERTALPPLPDGARALTDAGAVPADARAAAELYERTTADASLDVHLVEGGAARTIVPDAARAELSVRLAPDQEPRAITEALEALLRAGLPAGVTMTIDVDVTPPVRFDPTTPALAIARGALARAVGRPAALVRTGGSIPVLSAFAERGIPTVLSGFSLPDDNMHAPNERIAIAGLEQALRAARALYEDLGALRRTDS